LLDGLSLTKLDFGDNPNIKSDGWYSLLECYAELVPKHLETLDVSMCDLDDERLLSICSGLKHGI
jgi:hypothetical protein